MTVKINKRVLFNSVPNGYPVPGETLIVDRQEIDIETVPLAGGVLLRTLALSIDPYMRFRMREAGAPHDGPAIFNEFPPFERGKPIDNTGIARVLRSEDCKLKPGDIVCGWMQFAEYQVTPAEGLTVVPPNASVPPRAYLGVAGMGGKTAYYGWKAAVNSKKGETIYVSTAAGAVGSVVVQLAKAAGMKVIASAGTASKLDFVRSLGADVVFNYKEQDIGTVLAQHGPVDVYWDHIGVPRVQAVLPHMNKFGRIAVVGATTEYNGSVEPLAAQTFSLVFGKRLTIQGILFLDHEAQYGSEFNTEFVPKVGEGKIKYKEDIVRSLDEVGSASA